MTKTSNLQEWLTRKSHLKKGAEIVIKPHHDNYKTISQRLEPKPAAASSAQTWLSKKSNPKPAREIVTDSARTELNPQQQTRDDKLFRMLALWWRHEYDNDLTPDDYALLNQLEQELNAPVTKQQSPNQPIQQQEV